MKIINKVLFLLAFAVTISAAYADGSNKETKTVEAEKGIRFTPGKWAEILKKAKAENKIIFFDAYTTWCGPCKLLQKMYLPEQMLLRFITRILSM